MFMETGSVSRKIEAEESGKMNTVVIFGDVVVMPNRGVQRVDMDLPDPILDALSELYWLERNRNASPLEP